jgi:hypothetical protein
MKFYNSDVAFIGNKVRDVYLTDSADSTGTRLVLLHGVVMIYEVLETERLKAKVM